MLDYFRGSQEVRREIEADQNLLARISLAVTSSKGDLIGEGLHNRVYRIGQTKSGLFVALRSPMSEVGVEAYEAFCQIAAVSANQYQGGENSPIVHPKRRVRPVNFCIGVLSDTSMPAIVTEDVTEDGRYRIEWRSCDPVVKRFEGNRKIDEVMVDLDIDPHLAVRLLEEQWGLWNEEPKPEYFAEANRLSI